MTSPRLVDVALPLPLFRTFTYAVPDGLRHAVSAGARVVVPFRNRTVIGVVLGGAAPRGDARGSLDHVAGQVVRAESHHEDHERVEHPEAEAGDELDVALPQDHERPDRSLERSQLRRELEKAIAGLSGSDGASLWPPDTPLSAECTWLISPGSSLAETLLLLT